MMMNIHNPQEYQFMCVHDTTEMHAHQMHNLRKAISIWDQNSVPSV
jgi:hypothetical protein